ncbi:MAG: DUF2577 family protein [Clostridium sp.]|nr:DUF2577 family protein [Clostridium sp.]
MPDAVKLVKFIKKIALEAVEAAKPVQICFGTVKSAEPLKIYVDQKMTLGKNQLIVLQNSVMGETAATGGITAYAESFIGKIPYLLGAGRNYDTLEEIVAAADMCDCSAFTERVYRHFGAEIGTVVSAQESAGVSVSISDIKDGDLLILEDGWHAGIYKSGGQVIHEGGDDYTGNVKISLLSAFDLKDIRRITVGNASVSINGNGSLAEKDEVVLLRQQGGQKYIVMGKIK